MLLLLARLLATLLHIVLVLALAPLLAGRIARLRARLLGRRGPPVTQPYRSLLRLLRKTTLVPETSTDLYPVWPFAACAAMAGAAMLVPSFSTGMLTAPLGDFITIIGLLSLARAATLLGGLETGFGFGGAAAARELLVVLISFALIAHAFNIDAIATAVATSHVGISISLGFALVAMLAVALTETGHIPVDNPAGHLEVAMVHEALLLEYSGRYLLLFEYAAMLRLMVWMNIIATVFFPFFMARAGDPLTWPAGLALWVIKLTVMAMALPVFEVSMAKMRVFRVPEFLGAAILLGVLAGVFLFVAARIGT
jgi:formate hydrogenlyase subunit 4